MSRKRRKEDKSPIKKDTTPHITKSPIKKDYAPNITIAKVLNDGQKTFASHNKCLINLHKIYANNPLLFAQEFVPELNRMLVVEKRAPAIERVRELITNFAVHECDHKDFEWNDDFSLFLFKYLLSHINARSKAIRFRACNLIASLFDSMGANAELNEDLSEELVEELSKRTLDKSPNVRIQAVLAISRLQQPEDPDDPVIACYNYLLEQDNSKEVRKTVLKCMGITKLSLPLLLIRTRDISDDVRKTAYEQIKSKITLKHLSKQQRADIVTDGLTDRSNTVQSTVSDLVNDWLDKCNGNLLFLLKTIGVEEHEEECEILIRHFLKTDKGENTEKPPYEPATLTSEQSLFWRILCKYLSENNDEILENILPDTIKYCDILKTLYEEYKDNEYGLVQLLKLCSSLDSHDEVGNQKLCKLLEQILHGCCDEAIDPIMIVLQRRYYQNINVSESENEYIRIILDILNQLSKSKLNNISIDESTWLKLSKITSNLLQYIRKGLKHPGLSNLISTIILPAVSHANPLIRERGVMSLGLYCLFDINEVATHLPLLLEVLGNDKEHVQEIALKSLLDILMVFDINMIIDDNKIEFKNEELTPSKIYEVLSSYLVHDSPNLRQITVEGMSKLLTIDRVYEDHMLLYMILLYFDPSTEKDYRLRQCLTVFFPSFVQQSHRHHWNMSTSFIPIIRAFFTAPKNSPLHTVDPVHVTKFLLEILNIKHEKYEHKFHEIYQKLPSGQELPEWTKHQCASESEYMFLTLHEKLFIDLVYEILQKTSGIPSKHIISIFNLFDYQFSENEIWKKQSWRVILSVLSANLHLDKQSERSLQRLIAKIISSIPKEERELDLSLVELIKYDLKSHS